MPQPWPQPWPWSSWPRRRPTKKFKMWCQFYTLALFWWIWLIWTWLNIRLFQSWSWSWKYCWKLYSPFPSMRWWFWDDCLICTWEVQLLLSIGCWRASTTLCLTPCLDCYHWYLQQSARPFGKQTKMGNFWTVTSSPSLVKNLAHVWLLRGVAMSGREPR